MTQTMVSKTKCKIDGCQNYGYSGVGAGFCRKHGPRCSVNGCFNAIQVKGKCFKHHPIKYNRSDKLCAYPACQTRVFRGSCCYKHMTTLDGVSCYAVIVDWAPIHDCVKIGHSIDPSKRFLNGAKLFAPYKIIWQRQFETEEQANSFEIYARSVIGHSLDGEWVHLPKEQVIEILNKLG